MPILKLLVVIVRGERMSEKKTHEWFECQLRAKRIIPLEKYKGARIRVKVRCDICQHEWNVLASCVVHKSGCPACGSVSAGNKQRKKNKVISIEGNYLILDISTRQRPEASMLIDVADYERLKRIPVGRIHLDARGYCACWCCGKVRTVHALVCPDFDMVDHISRDKTDNRRCNLRAANKSTNAMNTGLAVDNTSGAKGVKFWKGKWRATIQYQKEIINLGRFEKFDDAVSARNSAELALFGEFSPLFDRSSITDKYQKG